MEFHDIILITAVVIFSLYLYGRWEAAYFRKKGVRELPASLPLVGHMLGALKRTEHLKDVIYKVYNAFPEERYVGVRQFQLPLIMVTDLELIKQIAIKDFDHFVDHLGSIDEQSDDLFGNSLFSLRGQKWRDMRATLSPAFTSSKMKGMFDFVAQCGKQMADYYLKELEKPENIGKDSLEVEMKDAFTRYTNDVIASTAFGLEVNSLEDRDNQFYLLGRKVTDFSGTQVLKFYGYAAFPKLMKFFRIPLFSDKSKNFFRSIISDAMEARERLNITRTDMIQLLIEARRGSLSHDAKEDDNEAGFAMVEESSIGKANVKRKWTDNDIIAQAILFFVAGFETSSTVLCFLAHELALHPEVQKTLLEEVDSITAGNDGKLTYHDLQNMKYMDMVVSETLRLWPPAVATDRKCAKPYSLPPPNSQSKKSYNFKTGEGIWIPIYGLHHDPKYFPDPSSFDPERFSDENKNNIKPFSYIPFGIGPRNCIGSRFALMEVKAVVYHVLQKFEFTRIPRTQDPIQLRKDTFNYHSEKGFWVGLKPRVLS